MSDFGSSEVASAIFIAGALAIPFFGWGVALGIGVIAVGYTVLICGANQGWYPDGTRKPQARRKRRGRNQCDR